MQTGSKTIVITGASKGIGKACALHLDQLGFRVFAGVRKQADADALQRIASSRLTALFIDVVSSESIAAAAEVVSTQVGQAGLWGLVNNAGIVISGPIEFLPVDEYRKQFEINFFGQIAVIQAFMPLIRQAAGRIVNMSSMSGHFGSPFLSPYSASKYSLEVMSDVLRREMIPFGIKVSVIEPSNTATPIWDTAFARAETMKENLPPEAHELYRPVLAAMTEQAQQSSSSAIPPIKVAQAVAHALTARKPKIRYPVGLNAKLIVWLAHLFPDRFLDWAVKKRLYK